MSEQPGVAPERLGWEQIGVLPDGGLAGLVGFDGGYVAFGGPGSLDVVATEIWYSADGRSWEAIQLGGQAPCPPDPGHILPEATVTVGASNGARVVLGGSQWPGEPVLCDEYLPVTWASDDGRTWTQSTVLEEAAGPYGLVQGINVVPEGWEASDGSRIWRSADGISWDEVAAVAQEDVVHFSIAAVSEDGIRVGSWIEEEGDDFRTTWRASTDLLSWRDVARPRDDGFVTRLLPAAPARARPWVAALQSDGEPESATAVSEDLAAWTERPFPMPAIRALAWTPFGLVAIGMVACLEMECPDTDDTAFLSHDGLTWTQLGSSVGADYIASGPAGVLAIPMESEEPFRVPVWRLTEQAPGAGTPVPATQGPAVPSPSPSGVEWTVEELSLLDSLRADARVGCLPRRTGLPARAFAGVECRPATALVDRVGAFLYPDDESAAATHLERLAEYGVERGSGDCAAGIPGDGAWTPGDEPIAYRFGCFRNELGIANVRATCGGGVGIGILGQDADIARLAEWAWRFPPDAELEVPSPPGICFGR